MDKKILGICVLNNIQDKTEKYVEYILNELDEICEKTKLVEAKDYTNIADSVMYTEWEEYDYILFVDTDGFGPVRSFEEVLGEVLESGSTFYQIPHLTLVTNKPELEKMTDYSNEIYNLYEDVAFNNYAFISKQAFINEKSDTLIHNNGSDLSKCMDYLQNELEYDVNIIYDYLIRHCNLNDIKESLNLNYILPEMYKPSVDYSDRRIAVVSHMYYQDLFEYDLRYLKNLPDNTDLYLTTESEEKKTELEVMFKPVFGNRVKVIVVEKRGRELSAFLISCKEIPKNYDYFCFIHDKKSSQAGFATVGASFRDLLWENMLYNRNYIEHIIDTFERNPWLGMLVPPNVCHGTYFGTSADYWTICYKKAVSIAKRLKLKANIDRDKPPIAIGSVFWCKSDAIEPLLNEEWSYEDFPEEPLPDDGSFSHALERIFPYVAQSQGYLSGVVMTTECAKTEVSNYRYMTTGMIKSLIGLPIVKMTTYEEMSDTVKEVSRLINEGEFDVGLKRTVKNFINKRTPLNIGGRK